jgi:alpha-L-arabinofuranosidase
VGEAARWICGEGGVEQRPYGARMAYQANLTMPTRRRKQAWAVVCAMLLLGCHSRSAERPSVIKPATALDEFSVVVATQPLGQPVNRMVLGNNVQWVDRGDDLLDAAGKIRPEMLNLVQALQPSILRYPGGSQADTYHWEQRVNEHFNSKSMQSTIMETQEFLEFCEAVGAQALISVNLASGTPEEAARWVAFTNKKGLVSRRTGKLLPAVKYWELGNEPYLKDDAQPTLWVAPEAFGQRAQAFIMAMRAADPTIEISLPLTTDRHNGVPATPFPGFTRRVLQQVSAPIDFVSLHDAYLPFGMDREYSQDDLYWGAMSASNAVLVDFQKMRAILHELKPAAHWPFAVTEYSAIFTLGRGAGDDAIASPVGALYIADLLRVLAQVPDVAMANYWSLSGNWWFGLIRSDANPRPAYAVLKLFSEALQGRLLRSDMEAQTVDTPSVGGSGAVHGMRLTEALAMRKDKTLHLVLIHKDDTRHGHGSVHLKDNVARSVHITELQWNDLWQVDMQSSTSTLSRDLVPNGGDITLDVSPHSVSLVTVELAH